MEFHGTIISGEEMAPIEGTIIVENGIIQEVIEEPVGSDDIIVPSFVNAHTHIGDSIAKETGRGLSVKEVVEPPDGLKHQLLEVATQNEIRQAMRKTMWNMAKSGTGTFVDFRENGIEGIKDIRAAGESVPIDSVALGRGETSVIDAADGYGASVVHYREYAPARKAAQMANKPFGIHAGERNTDDIDAAFTLEPDFIVHMVNAREEDYQILSSRDIDVVVCPRSNLVTGTGLPPIEELLEVTNVALGTDNVMLNTPSMWREMEFTSKLYDIPDREVLQMATINGARLLGRTDIGSISEGNRARLLILNRTGTLDGVQDPISGIVRRAGIADIERVVFDGEMATSI